MSVQRLFPRKDTSIISGRELEQASVGLDEILELGLCQNQGSQGISRILIQFNWDKIPENGIVHLHLFSATIDNLEKNNTFIEIYNLGNAIWTEGTGHMNDLPRAKDGASWKYRTGSGLKEEWDGGLIPGMEPFIVFPVTGADLDIDLTEYREQLRGSEGLLLKLQNEDVTTRLTYFSSNTHTIYRPYLEFIIEDSSRESELPVLERSINMSVKNLKEFYRFGDKIKLDLGIHPKYPKRTFSTSSLYLDSYILPEESYWGIKDEYTEEMVVEFNPGTKLSAGQEGNFFNLNTELLEPERYYRLLVQVNNSNETFTVDNKVIFKITRNGRK